MISIVRCSVLNIEMLLICTVDFGNVQDERLYIFFVTTKIFMTLTRSPILSRHYNKGPNVYYVCEKDSGFNFCIEPYMYILELALITSMNFGDKGHLI